MINHVEPRARIVIIDDDPILAELVDDLLVDEGFESVMCSRWRDAHTLVVSLQPDLVLLDLRFGGVEYGWQVLDELALDPSTRCIPVILWSGAHEALRAHAPALLPNHGIFTMTKPFDVQKLLETIDMALAERLPAQLFEERPLTHNARPDSGICPLTAREYGVAQCLARGYTNQRIADALMATPGQIANDVAHTMQKLGCSSRVEVARWANSSQHHAGGYRRERDLSSAHA